MVQMVFPCYRADFMSYFSERMFLLGQSVEWMLHLLHWYILFLTANVSFVTVFLWQLLPFFLFLLHLFYFWQLMFLLQHAFVQMLLFLDWCWLPSARFQAASGAFMVFLYCELWLCQSHHWCFSCSNWCSCLFFDLCSLAPQMFCSFSSSQYVGLLSASLKWHTFTKSSALIT